MTPAMARRTKGAAPPEPPDAAAIKAFRAEYGISQENLARRLGVSLNTIARWESGSRPPPDYLGMALATLGASLGVPD